MHLVKRGISIERVSLLGHSDAATTAKYYLHGDAPTAREQGFQEAGAVLVSIEEARRRRKEARSPWRRRKADGSFRQGPV